MDSHQESFDDAEATCENMDGTMININTVQEKDFLATWVGSAVAENIWIGLRYNDTNNQWTWMDGTQLDGNIM